MYVLSQITFCFDEQTIEMPNLQTQLANGSGTVLGSADKSHDESNQSKSRLCTLLSCQRLKSDPRYFQSQENKETSFCQQTFL